MPTDDNAADEPLPCQPEWIAHHRFVFYCAKSVAAAGAEDVEGRAPKARCTQPGCLFKMRG